MTLACPVCGVEHAEDERFCRRCGVPLTPGGRAGVELELRGAAERARKIKPQLAEGPLTQVAGARHQAEAELIQNLLLEEGVPSTLRRTRGFDVPEMLAAGPRDVLVPAAGLATARDVLLQSGMAGSTAPWQPAPARVLAGLVATVAVVALVVFGVDAL